MASQTIHGRVAVDRDGISERAGGAALATIDRWYANASSNGFPTPIPAAVVPGPYDWWWADEIDMFYAALEAAKKQALTKVDRTGDPGELLAPPGAAQVLGYDSHRNLPEDLKDIADKVTELPSGRKRYEWKRRTLWDYADSRTGKRGAGPRKGAPSNTTRTHTVDRTGDPDERVRSGEGARVLGYDYGRNLPEDLKDIADKVTELPSGRKRYEWKRRTLWAYGDAKGWP